MERDEMVDAMASEMPKLNDPMNVIKVRQSSVRNSQPVKTLMM